MRFLAMIPILLMLAAPAPPTFVNESSAVVIIRPDNANIQYTGRWDFSDPLSPWCAWQGSSTTVRFHGTELAAELNPGNSSEWFRVIIDGNHFSSRKVKLNPGRQRIVLAENPPPGPHRLDLIKETYAGNNATFFGFAIRGTGILPPPQHQPHRIVFYGDSNLAGYSNESEANGGANQLVGVHFGLSGILSRMLDAEYHNISSSGENLSGLLKRYDRMQWYGENPSWDFQRFDANVVVVNIGANDVGIPGRSEAAIRADYHQLLTELRVVHPNAHIVLANAVGWSFDEPANYIADVVTSHGDPNISAAKFPWVFEQWHGCQTDQAGMATYLAHHISQIMGWPMHKADVVNGFGFQGNVANGSFEKVAPFGGFAWRYFQDNKVRRVVSLSQAKDGQAFLRLTADGEVHQPNPARNQDIVEVTLWARGQGSATVTIDFHDQEMYSAPMSGQSTTLTLSPQWQQFQFQVSAPIQTPRPIFNTRLTLHADAGSVVDFDAISQTLR
jgi:lysophospholipase L1-like esterase